MRSRRRHSITILIAHVVFTMLRLSAILLLTTTIPSALPCSDCDGVNVTCVNGACLPRCVNLTSSGECLQCRDFMFWGQKCEKKCSPSCLKSRCHQNNLRHVCTDGCVKGRKGDNCEVACPPSCTQCERNGSKCVGHCSSPWYYGDKCEEPCPAKCMHGCKETGECFSCKPAYNGPFCNVTCPAGCSRCNQTTNVCIKECPIPGYYGDNCEKLCLSNCRDGCDRNEGSCHSCRSGYTGKYCDTACFPNCQICDLVTKQCRKCIDGTKGEFCDEQCPPNCTQCDRYKGGCTIPCLPNCEICDLPTGRCDRCTDGKRGQFCNETCPGNCPQCDRYNSICIGPCPTKNVYGRNCSFPCPLACDGCDRETGVCTACAPGYSRMYCDEMCSLCTGSRTDCNSNTCLKRDPHIVWKVVFGVLAAVVLIGLVGSVVFHRYRKKHGRTQLQQTKPRESSGPSDQSQYWVSKYYEIDDENLDPDSYTDSTVPEVPQRHSSPEQGPNQFSVRRDEPTIHDQPAPSLVEHHQLDDSGEFHSNADFVLEKKVYKSAEANTEGTQDDITRRASVGRSSFTMPRCKVRRPLLTKQADETNRCSETSEDLRLARKTESQIIWEKNTDFSEVYVKYISTNVTGNTSK